MADGDDGNGRQSVRAPIRSIHDGSKQGDRVRPCYHGSVDEALATLDVDGRTITRPGSLGTAIDASLTTVVVPFNDLEALEVALATGDIACVLAEPALTNIGIVLPDPGFHAELRRLTRMYETFLVIDETHTICVGHGGATAAWVWKPDSSCRQDDRGWHACGAYGMTAEIAERLGQRRVERR